MKTITEAKLKLSANKKLSDLLFILWAGGAALLSYSLVYALRKPFTAATFDGLEAFGLDYKVLVTIIQILGYLIAKFIGIKLISELKRENRLKFMLVSIAVAELSLVAFGLLPAPYNMFAMFFNGLSLGCMWGVIFSFIEGRRTTDILASLLGISIVISSGTAKSIGLFVMNTLNVSEFWMPALIGAFALPLLALLGYSLTRLPQPTEQDIEQKSHRVTLNGRQRKELFIDFMPFLILLFVANLMLVVLRDIKEDFLVKIIDMSGHSSWMFAQVDTVVTLIILALFGAMVFVRSNIKVLVVLLGLVVMGTATMSFVSFNYDSLQLDAITWLFVQSLCLYVAYLCFQSIFFDRFIACFKIKGNVGFFIVTIDFIGYTGTVLVLMFKEFAHTEINWLEFYNLLSGYVGLICTVAFTCSMIYLIQRYKKEKLLKKEREAGLSGGIKFVGEGMESTLSQI